VWKKYKKRTRLITLDLGGFDVLKPLVAAGLVETWVPIGAESLLSKLEKACEGYWRSDPSNPASKLLPPEYTNWEQIGLYAIEGLTSIGDQVIMFLQDSRASLSQDPSYLWSDGDRMYAGGNQTYYGLAQQRLYAMVMNSHVLPCEKVIWTALEGTGEEDRIPVYGPAIVGRKSTGRATQWFGNSVHIEGKQIVGTKKDEKTEQLSVTVEPIMFIQTHADPVTKLNYPAKHRAPTQVAAGFPQFLERPDITLLYDMLDAAEAKVAQTDGFAQMSKELEEMGPTVRSLPTTKQKSIQVVTVVPQCETVPAADKVVSVSPVVPVGEQQHIKVVEVKK
jgi:hypothetical protein